MAEWTKQDVYQVMNELVLETMGAEANLKAFDSKSFVACGERLKSYGRESVLNSLTMMITKTIFSSRPYSGKFNVLKEDNRLWGACIRKITHLYNEAIETKDNNTNLASPLGRGKSVDPFEQIPSQAVETVFIGTNEISKGLTTYTRTQFNVAFQSEEDFASFLMSEGIEWRNEITKIDETERRATVLNYVASCYVNNMFIDCADAFNLEYGTEYTQSELLGKYAKPFFEYISYLVENITGYFTEMSVKNHISIGGFDRIVRHTPKEDQRFIFFEPFFRRMKKLVLSNTFNPDYLKIGEYEGVNYWQNENNPSAISVYPSYTDSSLTKVENPDLVTIPYVLGVIYDVEAMGWYKVDETTNTVFNGRGNYFSTWYSAQSKPWNDMTENGVVLVIGAGGEPLANPVTTSAVAQNKKMFGVNVSDMQENDIVVGSNAITGTLKKLTGSNAITDRWGEGYFICLKFANVDGLDECKVGMNPSVSSGLVSIMNDPDKDGVFKVSNKNEQEFVLEIEKDGKKKLFSYDLSGLTLA